MTDSENIEKSTPKPQRLVGAVMIGILFGMYMALGPVLLIKHRDPLSILVDQPTQRWIFYIVDAISTAIAFGAIYIRHAVMPIAGIKPLQAVAAWLSQNRPAIVFALSVFLYKTCAVLCFKLKILLLPLALIHQRGWLYIGLAVGIIGALGLSKIFLDGSLVNLLLGGPVSAPPKKLLSASLAALFYLISIPLLFLNYFPLLAIPGAFICLRWQLRRGSGATKGGVEGEFSNS